MSVVERFRLVLRKPRPDELHHKRQRRAAPMLDLKAESQQRFTELVVGKGLALRVVLRETRQYAEESWCNGATGIGLAYLDLARHVPQLADYLGWAQRAHAATLARLDCRSPCLCHGSLGNAWLLQRYQPRTADNASVIAALLARIPDTIQREGVICGVQPNRAMPGLMSGVAGIGYGLLQLATSQPLPDPLSLLQ